jgi:histidyl-tRNA synthetase
LDAEVILLMVQILANLGLNEYELHINSVGCPVCREQYREKLLSHLAPVKNKLCPDCQTRYEKNPMRVLDCKVQSCHEAIHGFPNIYDSLCDDCRSHYEKVKTVLGQNGINYVHDNNLVRGLDYYTNTAFEIIFPI